MKRWIFLLATGTLAAQPGYFRDIRPILQKQCQGCHQPANKMSDLDVTTFDAFKKGGKRGTAIATVVKYLTGETQPRMPLGSPELPAADIAKFREWIAAGAKDDSPAETSSSQPIVYLQPPVITALRWSPDGSQLAVNGNREVIVHSSDGKRILHRLAGKAERILSISYSPKGDLLAAGGGTPAQFGEVQLWDPRSGKFLRSATLTNDTVFGAAVSPDGSRVSVGAADNTVHMIDTATGKELFKNSNHEGWVLGTVFGIDSKRFVTVSRDRAAKLTDSNTGAFLENVNLLRGELTAIARHPKKDVVAIGTEDRYAFVYMMDRPRNMKIADDTTLIHKIDRQDGAITSMDWSSDGSRIAIAGLSPVVNLYNADTGKLASQCKGHSAGIYSVAFSPDGKQLATGGFDGMVRVYSAATCQLQLTFSPVPLSHGNPTGAGQ